MKLSPLLTSALAATRPELTMDDAAICLRYVCAACQDTHRSATRAQECCMPESVWVHPTSGAHFDTVEELRIAIEGGESDTTCPVCTDTHTDTYAAADCCLWKDIGVDGRHQIARAVESGTSWAEAIAALPDKP
jgi:hypothetical protein